MQPITLSTEVALSPERVYDYLAVPADHEQFTDHMMRDWCVTGPARGVGARATVDVVVGGRSEPVASRSSTTNPRVRTVERNTGVGGKRVATGTCTLGRTSGGGTRITFGYAWQQVPLPDRITAPLVRRVLRKGLVVALNRLAERLRS